MAGARPDQVIGCLLLPVGCGPSAGSSSVACMRRACRGPADPASLVRVSSESVGSGSHCHSGGLPASGRARGDAERWAGPVRAMRATVVGEVGGAREGQRKWSLSCLEPIASCWRSERWAGSVRATAGTMHPVTAPWWPRAVSRQSVPRARDLWVAPASVRAPSVRVPRE